MKDANTVVDAGKTGQTTSAQANKPAEQTNVTSMSAKTEKNEQVDPFAKLDEVLASSKSRKSGGTKIRPNVGYTLIAENFGNMAGKSIPGQQQIVLQILRTALISDKAVNVGGVAVISEPELNKLVVAAFDAGTLKTKQDAWHIFTYYRPSMTKSVKDGGFAVLKQIDIPLAA